MTVHRLHRFTLDEAARAAGLALPDASGGLPRRIHPRYLDLVLSLSPLAAWDLGETSGDFLDATGGGRSLTPAIGGAVYAGSPADERGVEPCAPAVAGVDRAIRFGSTSGNNNYHHAYRGTVDLPLVPGVGFPWSFAGWIRWNGGYRGNGAFICGARDATGFGFEVSISSGITRFVFNDGAGKSRSYDAAGFIGSSLPQYRGEFHDGLWHHFVCTFDGLHTSGGIRFYFDGSLLATVAEVNTLDGTKDCRNPAAVFRINTGGFTIRSSDLGIDYDDCAVWNRVLSAGEIASLYAGATLPAPKRARWTRAFPSAATVRDVLLPGSLGRVLTRRVTLDRASAYLSTDGVTRTPVSPGSDPAFPVAPGQTLYLDVEIADCVVPPYLGGSSGEGPGLIYEEADPPLIEISEPVSGSLDSDAVSSTVQDRTAVRAVVR